MTFYTTAILSSLSLFAMLYVCTWKNVREIGKVPLYEQEEEKPKEIQMTEVVIESQAEGGDGENKEEKEEV